MASETGPRGNPILFALAGLAIALIGGIAGWMWHTRDVAANPAATLAAGDRAAIEAVVHDYILAHPEVLPQAMERLRQQESAKQLSGVSGQVTKEFPGAIIGNPNGKITLVEFTDFACTYCKQSVRDVDALVAANPDLKVVVRELPILSPESADAARMALAAAQQGKYAAFHRAMFEIGRPNPESIAAAATQAGMDLALAQKAVADPRLTEEINRNLDLARQLGFSGTPSWVVGEQLLTGAVGQDELARAIAAARG